MSELVDLEKIKIIDETMTAWPCIHVINGKKNVCLYCKQLILRGIECNHINLPFIKNNKNKWFRNHNQQSKIKEWLV